MGASIEVQKLQSAAWKAPFLDNSGRNKVAILDFGDGWRAGLSINL